MMSGSENVQFQWTIQSSILENFQLSVSMDLRSVKHKSMPYLQSNACKQMLAMLIYSCVYKFCGKRLRSLKQTHKSVLW